MMVNPSMVNPLGLSSEREALPLASSFAPLDSPSQLGLSARLGVGSAGGTSSRDCAP